MDVEVLAMAVPPTAVQSNERPAVAIDEGRVFVDCFNYMGSPKKVYDSVTFIAE